MEKFKAGAIGGLASHSAQLPRSDRQDGDRGGVLKFASLQVRVGYPCFLSWAHSVSNCAKDSS
jgi:hypothetical protein